MHIAPTHVVPTATFEARVVFCATVIDLNLEFDLPHGTRN